MSAVASVPPEPAFALPPLPYPGLRPFAQDEWRIFFGRELMVEEVLRRLVSQRLLVVHGDSGSGKSSLIYAGVLPVLGQQSDRSDFRWRTCHAVPGGQPIENLVTALAGLRGVAADEETRLGIRRALAQGRDAAAELVRFVLTGPSNPICLLLDQFEELFTQTPRGEAHDVRRQVIEFLIGLHQQPVEGFHAILTMRSEFLGSCAQYKDFAETVNETQYLLPRLKRQDLLRAICEPAHLYDGEVEPALAEWLIEETADTSDQLPLIQHGLMRLHHERRAAATDPEQPQQGERWKLTLAQYRDGKKSLVELLSDHADDVADAAEAEVFPDRKEPRVVERIFRAITKINADGNPVRNRQTLEQLAAITGETQQDLQAVLLRFRAEGVSFLRPFGTHKLESGDEVDISHEALIRCWNRVSDRAQGWLEREFRSGLAWRMLIEQAREFAADRSNVLSPGAAEDRRKLILAHTRAWSERYGGKWDEVNKLVAASLAAGKKSSQQRTALWVVLALVFVALTAVGIRWINTSKTDAVEKADVSADLERQRALLALAEQEKRLANIDILARAALIEPEPGDVQQQLTEIAEQAAASPSESSRKNIAPRLYFYVSDEDQRSAAQVIADKVAELTLANRAVVVPSVAVRRASHSALRCFSEDDCKEGARLFDSVKSLVVSPSLGVEDQTSNVRSGRMPATRPRHYELWFAPGPIVPSNAAKASSSQQSARDISFSQEIVDRIRSQPGVPYPPNTRPAAASSLRKVVAIVLHDAYGPDSSVAILISGRPDLRGPLAHWAVQSTGAIVLIADEGVRAFHAGQAVSGLGNSNTIGIEVTGVPALANSVQLENLVRLIADIADRWDIPTNLIVSHAEVAAGRKVDMLQQAPVIRRMVEAVRSKRVAQ